MSEKPVLWISRKLLPAVEERARQNYDVRLNPEDKVFTGDEIVEMSKEVDAILPCHSEHFSADVVARMSDRVKIIANHSVGVDHCDLAALKEKGIVVTNTPDVLSKATAEIALLLMLGAARRANEGNRLMRSGEWNHWGAMFMVGTQMTDKRLGIVGMGRIGQAFAKIVQGFDMEIHYYSRNRVAPEIENGAIYHSELDDLLKISDFLSLNCPSTPETYHLMNAEKFALLPKGAVVVNTARGTLIDETALYDALKSGHIAAAGLDVFETEPGGNPKFSELDNIFMLPHIGSATVETRNAMGFRALDNLDAYFAGKEPGDRVA